MDQVTRIINWVKGVYDALMGSSKDKIIIAQLRNELESSKKQLRTRTNQLNAANTDKKDLNAKLAEAKAAIVELKKELKIKRPAATSSESGHEVALKKQLGLANADRRKLRDELTEAKDLIAELKELKVKQSTDLEKKTKTVLHMKEKFEASSSASNSASDSEDENIEIKSKNSSKI